MLNFCHPVIHAVSLIDACGGNVEDAKGIARGNAMEAPIMREQKDNYFWYWIAVRDALLPEKGFRC